MMLSLRCPLQEAEDGTEAAIDPGGQDVSGSPPTNQAEDDEGGGQAVGDKAEGEGAGQVEEEEKVIVRRLSLQAVAGIAASEQDEEESKPDEEDAGPANSEPIPTERDGEEGSRTPTPQLI